MWLRNFVTLILAGLIVRAETRGLNRSVHSRLE
ncbi:hypothetical protein EV561_14011 [Rhizobium sp. BK376]|nr:hypothetical protein EV561_14011 [Rhizobium sp. BK376]